LGLFSKKDREFCLFGRSRIETGPTEALSVIICEVVKKTRREDFYERLRFG